MAIAEPDDRDSLRASIYRGTRLLGGVGAVLGGVAGTLVFPILGTLVGALVLGLLGAAVGWVDAVLLWAVRRRTRSPWAARVTSGALALVVAVPTGSHLAPVLARLPALVIVLGAVGVAYATALGPLIAAGEAPRPDRGVTARPLRLAATVAQLGTAFGAVAGGACGLVVAVTATPTPGGVVSAVAAFALIGLVNGGVLACAVVGITIVPCTRARP